MANMAEASPLSSTTCVKSALSECSVVCSPSQGHGQCETTLDGLALLSAQPLRLEAPL